MTEQPPQAAGTVPTDDAGAAEALAWIVTELRVRNVPFQAVGGLAARAYGATRPLVDLDFYVPLRCCEEIEKHLGVYMTRPFRHFRNEAWDITFAQLLYAGQKIELGVVEGACFFDPAGQRWVPQVIDFAQSVTCVALGVRIPVMPRHELITYKSLLNRDVDRLDIQEMKRLTNRSFLGA